MSENSSNARTDTEGSSPVKSAKTGRSGRVRKPRTQNAPPSVSATVNARRAIKNSDRVYNDLFRDIVSLSLPPGAPILEKEITKRYGISRTPVREAVLRLADEHLLDVVPKSGTFVARIPLTVLREGLVARRALEEVTVRAATARASASQIEALREVIDRQSAAVEDDDEDIFHSTDQEFHAGIAAAGRLPGLWDIIQQTRVQIERYRRLTLPQPGRMSMVIGEHAAVLDAIANGEADTAVAAMIDHLNKLRLDIAVFRDMWPDYFVVDPYLDGELLGD